MDKYEFNIKAEQMRKMADQGDYKTAMQIADAIDWRRVRNANLLSYVADIYEKNKEYEEAKDILLLAFERAPVGKRFLFKLSEISVEAGDLQDAQEFYREFCEMSPDDTRQFLLRYMILKAKGASPEQLIAPLEEYTSEEVDEEWLYTLAKLYSEAGYEDECVRTCDKIMLLFGLGQYVDKAMELKLQYRSLSKEQMDLVENRSKYEEKLRKVSEEYADTDGELVEAQSPELKAEVDAEKEAQVDDAGETVDKPVPAPEETSTEEASTASESEETVRRVEEESATDSTEKADTATITANAQPIHGAAADAVEAIQSAVHKVPQNVEKLHNYHMIIEAKSRDDGLKIAIDEIKYFHDLYGFHFKVAKTEAAKLNERGFAAFIPKIEGKDLIVENAGALTYDVVDEIGDYIDTLTDSSSVVLVDVMDHFDRMAEDRPLFIKKFDLVSDVEDEEEDLVEDVNLDASTEEAEETKASQISPEASTVQSAEEEHCTQVPLEKMQDTSTTYEAMTGTEEELPQETVAETSGEMEESTDTQTGEMSASDDSMETEPAEEKLPKDYYQTMSIEDFANYAQAYAREIDCVMSGKTVLALYERIELMQEDGIELTKESAEELIEEAADKAEKPSLGKKLTGMFHPKYDKENRLILREDNFIN